MRPMLHALSTAGLAMLMSASLPAQQAPDFNGQWQREDGNDLGSGWGDMITVSQKDSRLQVEYASFHTVGLHHSFGSNNAPAYKSGHPPQRQAYRELLGTPAALVNPDHLVDIAY